MSRLFISHSSQDDGFVREMQQALGNFKLDVWIDSRQLRGGDPLWQEVQKGIEEASAYVENAAGRRPGDSPGGQK
jgi:hypothetical protein